MAFAPITPAALQAAEVGIDKVFQQAFKDTPTYWDSIASKRVSNSREDLYPWMALIPELREWLGPRQVVGLEARFQRLMNKKFERTIGVKREDIEDDRLGLYTDAFQELARVTRKHPDKLVVDTLQAGVSTAVYDNQNFFDDSHPVDMDDANSATQSNLFGTKPLTAANIAAVKAAMAAYKVDNNVPLEVVPNVIVVPPQLEYAAKQAIEADLIAQAVGNNAAAAVNNVLKGTMRVVMIPRLANEPDIWYLADTSRSVKPLIYQERMAPEFAARINPDDPKVFELDEYQWGVRCRDAAGYGPWFLMARVSQT